MEKWVKGDSRNDASLFPLFLMTESATLPMQKALGVGLSGLMISFHGKNWVYYERKGELGKVAQALVKKIEEKPDFVENAIMSTYNSMKPVFKITGKIYGADLGKKSNTELLDYYLDYCRKLKVARGFGWIAPALDISGFLTSKLEGILRRHLKGREGEVPKYFNILTNPDKITTMRKEERKLLEMAAEAGKNKQLAILFGNGREVEILTSLEDNHPQFFRKLKEHHENYLWLPAIFEGRPWKIGYFVSAISGMLKGGTDPDSELRRLGEKAVLERRAKQAAFRDLPLTKEERHLFHIASEILFFKAERKDLYQKSYFEFNPLLIEIGKRIGLTLRQVRFMLPNEVKEALLHGKTNGHLLDERFNFSVAISENDATKVYVGKEAEKIIKEGVEKQEVNTDVMELKGQCANPGFAKGIVKQIL
ncbi:MAG TPA: hypothetical protein VJI13_01800, partial [Candidatus Norongarragalinales archaeon]|nr:hypothetical protein [Candidatus Norongarragalinales archaeon]